MPTVIGNPQTGQMVLHGDLGEVHDLNLGSSGASIPGIAGPVVPYGQWRAAPNMPDGSSTVKGRRSSILPFLGSIQAYWILPNGSEIILDDTEVRCETGFWDPTSLSSVSVRVSRNTLPGMVAYGLIGDMSPQDIQTQADQAESDKKKAEENSLFNNPLGQVADSLSSIMVVALVVAAIWFLPRSK